MVWENACQSEILLADSKGNFNGKRLASIDPDLALQSPFPRLIDEWQEVPSIWDAVRSNVDRDDAKGKYILTGSATINRDSCIHSGCGRIARLKMRTMSLLESGSSSGLISLKDICLGNADEALTGEVSLEALMELVLKGGWPSLLNGNYQDGMLLAKEYINAVLDTDIYRVDGTKRAKHKVELLLRSLARNEATTATNKKLMNDISEIDCASVSIDTITNYLELCQILFLTENIPPFSSKLPSSLRVKQAEKRHFADPSLPCALLGLSKGKLLEDLEFFGFLFESLAESDLLAYAESFHAKLYHYQDYDGNEIDAVIELDDLSWCGVEIKVGANQIDEASANLIRINESIIRHGGKGARALMVICGMSDAAYRRKDGVYVVPLTALRD